MYESESLPGERLPLAEAKTDFAGSPPEACTDTLGTETEQAPAPQPRPTNESPNGSVRPGNPDELFPYADPAMQLNLYTLTARLKTIRNGQPSEIYKAAHNLPRHQVYSLLVQRTLKQLDETPKPRGEKPKKPRSEKSAWRVAESAIHHYGRQTNQVVRKSAERAKEIIPPDPRRKRDTNRQHQRRQLRALREAQQDAWDRARLFHEESQPAVEKVERVTEHVGGVSLTESLSTESLQALGVFSSEEGRDVLARVEYRRQRQITESERTSKRRQDQRAVKALLEKIDLEALRRGILDISYFPDAALRRETSQDTSEKQLAFITGNYKINHHASSLRLRRPEATAFFNLLLLFRDRPLSLDEIANRLAISPERIMEVYKTMGAERANLIQGADPQPQGTVNLHTETFMLNPAVTFLDQRDEKTRVFAPRRIFKELAPDRSKPTRRKHSRRAQDM